MGESFRQLLARHMERRQLASARKLSTAVREFYRRANEPLLAKLAPQTIQHWIATNNPPAPDRESGKGVPHTPLDVLRVAATLGLNKVQTTRLLLAADKPTVDTLLATTAPHELLGRALRPWTIEAPHNLPAPLSSFIGREEETLALAELLTDPGVRLVTLTGTGGSGKTRLALEAARSLLDTFTDGIYLAPLEAVEDPQQVTGALLRALGLPAGEIPSRQRRLINHLQHRRLLLVIDNLEHLPEAIPELTTLLERAPRVQFLVTSRIPLRAYGEHEWPVAPLPLPDEQQPTAELGQNPAIALFAARARAVMPAFALTSENAGAVRQICTLLAGLPLALELAAARVRELTPDRLLWRFSQPLDLAADGPVDRTPRQQSLRQAIGWSYRLLTPEQRGVFRRLAVFRGHLPREAAVAVCADGASDVGSVTSALDELVAHSLVIAAPDDGTARYRLLEPIREYAREELLAHGEAAPAERRLAEWCIALAEQMAYPLEGGAAGNAWLRAVDRDLANIRAALDWAREHDPALGARLVAAVWPYWLIKQELDDGQHWIATVLERAPADSPWRAPALRGLGMLNVWNDLPAAYQHLTTAQALAAHQGDPVLINAMHWPLSLVAFSLGNVAEARAHLAAGWPTTNLPGRPGLHGIYRMLRGYLAEQEGRRADAANDRRAALADATAADQPLFQCMILSRLHGLTVGDGDPAQAREGLARLRQIAERIGAAFYSLLALFRLGMLHELNGDFAAAEDAYRACLRLAEETGRSRVERAASLLGLGRLALSTGQFAEAYRALDSAATIASQLRDQRLVREVSLPLTLALWERSSRPAALRHLADVLATWESAGDPSWLVAWVELAAILAIASDEAAAGATWLAAADRARKRGLSKRLPYLQRRIAAAQRQARDELGAQLYRQRCAEGQLWTRDHALTVARNWVNAALTRVPTPAAALLDT
ncbi:MAG: AAA family ATPase [Chloroflexia bacterium]